MLADERAPTDCVAAPSPLLSLEDSYDRLSIGSTVQPLKVPLGSLNRLSPCDMPLVGAAGVVPATDVGELPHNSRTVGETVGVRSST